MPLDPSKIIAHMKRRNVSRAELARRTGIPAPHVTRMLARGPHDALLSTAETVAEALGVTVGKILSERKP